MKTMNIPGFTAEQSLHQVRGRYHSGRLVAVQPVPSSPRFRGAKTATSSSRIARITAGSRVPSAMPAIRADVFRARRIPAATAGTITLRGASSATCEWERRHGS